MQSLQLSQFRISSIDTLTKTMRAQFHSEPTQGQVVSLSLFRLSFTSCFTNTEITLFLTPHYYCCFTKVSRQLSLNKSLKLVL